MQAGDKGSSAPREYCVPSSIPSSIPMGFNYGEHMHEQTPAAGFADRYVRCRPRAFHSPMYLMVYQTDRAGLRCCVLVGSWFITPLGY